MFKHYIGLDWSQTVMAISRRTPSGKEVQNFEIPSRIADLKEYFKLLKGDIILTFEETTGAQWLYTELHDCVTKLVVCDPYRNKLLLDGPKTDRIDARKLSKLLYADMIKPVFHSGDELLRLRKLVSGYEDLIKSGVRNKNQLSAIDRGLHFTKHSQHEQFVARSHKRFIEIYEEERENYKSEFYKLAKKYKPIRDVDSIPGIGIIGAVTIVATIVDINRFSRFGKLLSYSGLISLEKISGGASYGRRKPRYSRQLKRVFDAAAMSIINGGDSALKSYYLYLITKKNYAKHNAKKALARRVASITFGVMKTKKRFNNKMIKH